METFVAIDIELANDSPLSICEISAVKFVDGAPVAELVSLVLPVDEYAYVLPINQAIHGLSEDDLAEAPSLDSIWPSFADFIGDSAIVGHNATQDLNKIHKCLEDFGMTLPDVPFYCTLTIARRIPDIDPGSDYKLGTLAGKLNVTWAEIERNPASKGHSAKNDALAAGLIFAELVSRYENDSSLMLRALEMRPGVIKNGSVAHGNTAIPKPNPKWVSLDPKQFAELVGRLESEGQILNPDHPFHGKNIALSLFLDSMSEVEFWHCIALAGGQMKTSVSKKVDFLVEGDDRSGKYKKGETTKSKDARALLESQSSEVRIIDEREFLDLLGSQVLSRMRDLFAI